MIISFRTKLAFGFAVVLILISGLLILFFYGKAHYVERDNLRHRLIGIATTGALMIDGDKHELLREPADQTLPEFEELRWVLTRIRKSNPKITYVYTMRKTDDPMTFSFVIDEAEEIDDNENGIIDPEEETADIGDPYDASLYPAMRAAYEGPAADRRLESDQWGTWLSGYAPIFNSRMEPVGILGIDMAADDVLALEQRLKLYGYLIFGTAVIASVIAGVLLSRHFTAPIEKLLSGIRQVTGGELETQIEINRKDEIGMLGTAFNTMTESLRESRQKLDEYNRLLEEKVKARTRELKEAQDTIVHAEKMAAVGALAGGVAHEFNNLFACIRGRAELALEVDDPAQKKKALEVALQMADRAKKITAALLSYSRVDEKLRKEKIDLREVIELSLSLFKLDLNRYNIKLIKDFQPLPAVLGDRNQLQHAICNILANARDAMSESGGLLTVETGREGENVFIKIVDTGAGIEPGIRERIFEPFRGSKGLLAGGKAGYAGLGLFSALGIVKSHGGEIKVESRPGKGATFTIFLPLPPRSALEEYLPRELARPAFRPAAGFASAGKILLVDDEDEIAEYLEQFLAEQGFATDVARSGREAVELARKKDYRLIYIDIAMPDMNGEAAMEEILSFKPEARFAIISGFTPYEFRQELKDHIVDYLQKPFSLSQVAAAAFKVFESSAS